MGYKAFWTWVVSPSSLTLALAFSPACAFGQLQLCNGTSGRVSIALQLSSSTYGWWNLDPDECATPHGGSLADIGSVAIHSEPATRVRGVQQFGPEGGLSWCVSSDKFKFEELPRPCEVPFRPANFTVYDIPQQTQALRWTLELSPLGSAYASQGRGGSRPRVAENATEVSREPRGPLSMPLAKLPPMTKVARPRWTAQVWTTEHSLTSESGRKDWTWQFDSPPNTSICTYRVREISNIGKYNHYELTDAYSSNARLALSVKPEHLDVANWAEIHPGSKATLKIAIDWYVVQPGNTLGELSETLKDERRVWEDEGYWTVQSAFNSVRWPEGLRCRDRPDEVQVTQKESPAQGAPSPTLGLSSLAAMLVACVDRRTSTGSGRSWKIQSWGQTCESARVNALSEYESRDHCQVDGGGARFPEQTKGPYRWLQTTTCAGD